MNAKIAVKKNVVKHYKKGNKSIVYLKKATEFEIELFNPTEDTLLAKISLNGKNTSNGGIILKPGERIFLERFLDDDKKYKFDVYEVENNNKEVENAIKNNGLVEVFFFKEKHFNNLVYSSSSITCPSIPKIFYDGPNIFGNSTCWLSSNDISTTFTSSSANVNLGQTKGLYDNNYETKETGRITGENKSEQKFSYVFRDFENNYSYKTEIQILPESQKIYGENEIKVRRYCSYCGKKVNPTDKFCSQCGEKL